MNRRKVFYEIIRLFITVVLSYSFIGAAMKHRQKIKSHKRCQKYTYYCLGERLVKYVSRNVEKLRRADAYILQYLYNIRMRLKILDANMDHILEKLGEERISVVDSPIKFDDEYSMNSMDSMELEEVLHNIREMYGNV